MIKAELIIKVSKKENIPVYKARTIVDLFFEAMKEALERGERVEVRGFGSFGVKSYKSYKGRNPKTGEIVDVPPKRLPFFKVGKELKEMVNRK
jgi:integration host factor subunit beta